MLSVEIDIAALNDANEVTIFTAMKHDITNVRKALLSSLTKQDMDDNEVIKTINGPKPNQTNKANTASFIFSLKNRVGGLARALRVFQVCCSYRFFFFWKVFIKRLILKRKMA